MATKLVRATSELEFTKALANKKIDNKSIAFMEDTKRI